MTYDRANERSPLSHCNTSFVKAQRRAQIGVPVRFLHGLGAYHHFDCAGHRNGLFHRRQKPISGRDPAAAAKESRAGDACHLRGGALDARVAGLIRATQELDGHPTDRAPSWRFYHARRMNAPIRSIACPASGSNLAENCHTCCMPSHTSRVTITPAALARSATPTASESRISSDPT